MTIRASAVLAAGAFLAALTSASASAQSPAPSASPAATFAMLARNGSKLTGTVELAQAMGPGGESAVSVSIKLDGMFIPETEYPAGIYSGACTDTATVEPKWKLKPVNMGRSTTVLYGQTVQSLEAALYSVSVQAENAPTNVLTCGVLTPR